MRKLICLLLFCLANGLRAQTPPAVIPFPVGYEYTLGAPVTDMKQFRKIYYSTAFKEEALLLQSWLQQHKIKTDLQELTPDAYPKGAGIILQHTADVNDGESYGLEILASEIRLRAGTATGIFYGIQTLQQLAVGNRLPLCSMEDRPAFSWRGYMVDVGRNYQSVPLLKQQIDMMAHYKLNVFQFHFTEDIAWRWEVPGFPQLTADSTMIRDKGKYYTNDDIRELMQYCAARHILFVPEIDMPGHSAAFKRAMGVDMQSDSGMLLLKQVVGIFLDTFKVQYLHVGGDEVKIIKKDFLPEMICYIESKGVTTLGWDPGGNIPATTIHQLWMRDGAVKRDVRYLDSRHLYLNHMDPLESVMTIWQRRICDTVKGNNNRLGAVLCLWNDRRVAAEADLLRMNPVYPAMMAFAERSWRGGGEPGWRTNIERKDLAGFKEFEVRLLKHQQRYFKKIPFPYSRQSDMQWDITTSAGDTAKAIGGTVVLRHFWAPLVQGVLPDPHDSTTVYATTKLYFSKDTIVPVWIGFYNLSRSTASNTPAAGTWDNKGSSVTVNGRVIAPPRWQYAGRKGNSEEPLADEGYEYRAPTNIYFKKGMNTVKITAPVQAFTSADWNNPVKWMFTFLPLTKIVNND
ncbi:family 20 glycosylhydrolase [Chitinophaga sp. Cy-1792]|uniref:family 20 glycosylhydrolase n=1 Tax=Chitinophaga sp. Cy-1792 TaxID=2608339 RepID=UPI0014210E98|nr:family 20 glycosylhydrolase [Chitinophaga sp. Cy-1792]NIG55209.1 family 20 glycosylhydrolase [Chitinophaga sp. Cy-1792]